MFAARVPLSRGSLLWSFAPLFIMVVVDFLSISPFMMPYDYTLFVAGILGGSLPRNCGCPQHPQQTPTFVPENLRDMLSSLIDSAP